MLGETELLGWKAITNFLHVSKPTALRYAREQRMPVTLLGGRPYTTAERLDQWKLALLEQRPYVSSPKIQTKKRRRRIY